MHSGIAVRVGVLVAISMLVTLACRREEQPQPQSSDAATVTATPSAETAAAPVETPTSDVLADPLAQYRMELTWTPYENSRSGRFETRIIGGPDSAPEMHCQDERWDFGDGEVRITLSECPNWQPDFKFRRSFEVIHWYDAAGEYLVSFAYGTLKGEMRVRAQ
ncbi:MAG: hypothetical protein HY681_03715 [Chloroflexi bacterium]|nr:hypothetical protein [Chloroflexota bacterium]